jgi:hypothetical protein
MRFDRGRAIAIAAALFACVPSACGGSERLLRDESIPIERRVESEDRTVAQILVHDDALVVMVERHVVCQRGTYDDRVVEEPVHGSGWLWGGIGTIAGGAAIAGDKDGSTAGAVMIVGGAALVIVGVAKLAEGHKQIETKGEAVYGKSQTCSTKPVRGAFISVSAGPDNLAVQSTDDTGSATLAIDAASWERAPLTVHVDLPHEKTVVLTVTRDGVIDVPEPKSSY